MEESLFIVKRGDLFWVDFGKEKGSVQAGLRPALAVSSNINNDHSPVIVVVPVTSKINKHPMLTHVSLNGFGLKKESLALCEQPISISKKSLKLYIGKCDKQTMKKIDKALMLQLQLGGTKEEKEISHEIEELKYWIRSEKEFGFNLVIKNQIRTRIKIEKMKLKEKCLRYNINIDNLENLSELKESII